MGVVFIVSILYFYFRWCFVEGFIDLVLALFLAFSIGRLLEEGFSRLGVPSVLGDLSVGIVFGASLLGWYPVNDVVKAFSVFGVFLLLFYAGLETRYSEFMRSLPVYGIITLGEVLAAFSLGYIIGISFGYPPKSAYFVGTVLVATSVSVSVKSLVEIKKLHTLEGYTVMGIAVLDDLAALITIVVGASLVKTGTINFETVSEILLIAISAWLIIVVLLHRYGSYISRLASHLHTDESILVSILATVLGLTLLSQYINLSPLVIAYAAGLGFSEAWGSKVAAEKVRLLAVLFSPLFFITTTAEIDLKTAIVPQYIPFYTTMIIAAFIGKLLGGGLTSFLVGYPAWASFRIGVGLFPRAEFCIIAAYMGYTYHVIGADVYLAALLIIVATNFLTPPILKYVYSHGPQYDPLKFKPKIVLVMEKLMRKTTKTR
ncbi:sodium/hydrogen exchanger [Staphylothermus marinus F1]|uniref:Sodium/hydrogen exchanger n=1 Tax=Staphylothermus marinus (strain ATCC 43588 / DSM 3639 / JCM 9404 / F1) TaxID=399550 RepID=A3DMA5_STAMF|nr:sodium/hydrogen exchanger [Staphylothermus marinus F1]